MEFLYGRFRHVLAVELPPWQCGLGWYLLVFSKFGIGDVVGSGFLGFGHGVSLVSLTRLVVGMVAGLGGEDDVAFALAIEAAPVTVFEH